MRTPVRHGRIPLAALAVAISVAIVVAACTEVTAPVLQSSRTADALSGASTVIVAPEDMKGWSFVPAVSGDACAGDGCRMVDGPATPPLGRGSAELRATMGGGSSLVLSTLQGTRLDALTALGYATFRHNVDTENHAEIALELTVDFDLAGGGAGDVGQIVFEPALNGDVTSMSGWRGHDALAGVWWARHQAAAGGALARVHPCVRTRPCTWAELLARYPGAGVHASAGTIALTALRGRGVRGNADSLVIGVAGASTTYDFELVARREQFALATTIQDGAVANRFPAETLFDAGTVVRYDFGSRPGRAEPLLVLDDTLLLPAAGEIVMDARHRLTVVSDTLYTYETLTPMEKRIADDTRALLTASDKMAALQRLVTYMVDQLNAGVDPAVLTRAEKIAQFVVVDPVRDAEAMDAVDVALTGVAVDYQLGYQRVYGTVFRLTPAATGINSSTGMLEAMSRARLGSEPATPSASLSPEGSVPGRASIPNPDRPAERTLMLYMNGIWTQRSQSAYSSGLILNAVYKRQRFGNYNTRVYYYYNPTRSEQMKQYMKANPCRALFDFVSSAYSVQRAIVVYAACIGQTFTKTITSSDWIESATALSQLRAGWQPTNKEVVDVANVVKQWRGQNWHVMLLGHSEGTILLAQAIRRLPEIEQHPLQVANRCVTMVAMAPATSFSDYGMDAYHLHGFLANHDFIRVTSPTEWETVHTSLTEEADAMLKAYEGSPVEWAIQAAAYGKRIHSVDDTYLSEPVLTKVVDRLTQQHKECIAGTAAVEPSALVAPVGMQFRLSLRVWNQNGRELFGRTPRFQDGYVIAKLDTLLFRAMVPWGVDRPYPLYSEIGPDWGVSAGVTVPVMPVEDFYLSETRLWKWVVIGGANGLDLEGRAVNYDGPPPSDPWDGSPESCNVTRRLDGAYGSYAIYQLRCNRTYTPMFLRPDSLFTGRPLVASWVHWTTTSGAVDSAKFTTKDAGTFYYFCAGGTPCLTEAYVEHMSLLGVAMRSPKAMPMVIVGNRLTPLAPVNARVSSAAGDPSPGTGDPAVTSRSGPVRDGLFMKDRTPAPRIAGAGAMQ